MNEPAPSNQPWVGLSHLRIESAHPNSGHPIDEDTIKAYANGRQQIPIRVIFEAIDANGVVTTMPDSDRLLFRLIDYHTGNSLQGEWDYSPTHNPKFHYFDGVTRHDGDALNKKAEQLLSVLHLSEDVEQEIRDSDEKWNDFKQCIARGEVLMPEHPQDDLDETSQSASLSTRARSTLNLWITTKARESARVAVEITCPNGNKATIRSNARVNGNGVEAGGDVRANYSESSIYASPQQPKPPAEYRYVISAMEPIYVDWNDGVCWYNRYLEITYMDRQLAIVDFTNDAPFFYTCASDKFRRDHKYGVMSIHWGNYYNYYATHHSARFTYGFKGIRYEHWTRDVIDLYGGQRRKSGQLIISMTWLWANIDATLWVNTYSYSGIAIDINGNEHRVRFRLPDTNSSPHEFYVERS